MTSSNAVFERLSPAIRESIASFQRHIISEYQARSENWSEAHVLIQKIADRLVNYLSLNEVPVDPEPVAKALGVQVSIVVALDAPAPGGQIAPMPNGFKVVVFTQSFAPSRHRLRFTLAHECGHVFFFHSTGGTPEPIIPRAVTPGEWKEEGLCHAFARALLIPTNLALGITKAAPSLETLFAQARRCQVSPESLVRRILHDLEGWQLSVFYKINLRTRKATVFRGSKRKGRAAAPACEEILSLVADKSARLAVTAVAQRFARDQKDCRLVNGDLWLHI